VIAIRLHGLVLWATPAACSTLCVVLVYLDQNYASRVAKFLLGQRAHAAFGELHRALRETKPLIPPSPFHVLETRGGYLLPTLQEIFGEFSSGYWVRPYQEVVARQVRRGGLNSQDLVHRGGSWSTPATLEPLGNLFQLPLQGTLLDRRSAVREALAQAFDVAPYQARLPFFDLLARLVAFRSMDDERLDRPSDLTDLVMAATVAPYVDALATDRYLAEMLRRVGYDRPLFSGRRPGVLRFAGWLRKQSNGGKA
jgi:hypothetical protein